MDIAVIGLGLIGGSLVRAFARSGHRVLGYDADPATRGTARTAAARAPAGARWEVTASVADAVSASELSVIAVPLPAIGTVLDGMAGYPGLVTDVTSVKAPVRDLVAQRRPGSFVGGHPMAGREVSGFAAADPTLFDGAAWVLCLEPDTVLADWLRLATLITSLGARVVPATAEQHDHAVALVSHVPHLVASALAQAAATDPLALTLGAGSFRDGTRVAASRPDLVAAMCGGNAGPVLAALAQLHDTLARAEDALADPEPMPALRPWLAAGHAARTGWPPRAASSIDLPARADTLLRLGQVGGWVTAVADDLSTVTAVRPTVTA